MAGKVTESARHLVMPEPWVEFGTSLVTTAFPLISAGAWSDFQPPPTNSKSTQFVLSDGYGSSSSAKVAISESKQKGAVWRPYSIQ
jgi:hypothetical protein